MPLKAPAKGAMTINIVRASSTIAFGFQLLQCIAFLLANIPPSLDPSHNMSKKAKYMPKLSTFFVTTPMMHKALPFILMLT
jgi:hypothetical protein